MNLKRFNFLFLFPIVLFAFLFACENPSKKFHWESSVHYASVYDSLPEAITKNLSITEIQGYVLAQGPSRSTHFLEYRTNHKVLLQQIALLPFALDSIKADVGCRKVIDQSTINNIQDMITEGHIARSFSWNESMDDFEIYECLKTPQHHIIMLSKNSDRVIHIIDRKA